MSLRTLQSAAKIGEGHFVQNTLYQQTYRPLIAERNRTVPRDQYLTELNGLRQEYAALANIIPPFSDVYARDKLLNVSAYNFNIRNPAFDLTKRDAALGFPDQDRAVDLILEFHEMTGIVCAPVGQCYTSTTGPDIGQDTLLACAPQMGFKDGRPFDTGLSTVEANAVFLAWLVNKSLAGRQDVQTDYMQLGQYGAQIARHLQPDQVPCKHDLRIDSVKPANLNVYSLA